MKLQYVGLKPIINEHGIDFKNGKEDKFVYLSYAIDILNAINHTYEKKRTYSHELPKKRLNEKEILDTLLKFRPNLEETIKNETKKYLTHLEEEIQNVKDSTFLKSEEKEAFINNLNLMREYRIQRRKNKIFYYNCVEMIVENIIKYKIKDIDTPFNEKFWHILKTMKGILYDKNISSELITEEKDILRIYLLINIS